MGTAMLISSLLHCVNVVPFFQSLSPSSTHYKFFEILPPTIVELGISRQHLIYRTVDTDYAVFLDVLNNANWLPKLKLLWVFYPIRRGPDVSMVKEMAKEIASICLEWRLMLRENLQSQYGSEREI